MIDNPLSYVLVKPNIINEFGLKEIVSHIENSSKTDLSVFDPQKSNQTGGKEWIVNKEVRDTQIVDAGPLLPKIIDLLKNTVKEVINPFYGVEISESEIPQILSYSIGGHYCPHIDGESLWQTPNQELIWKKSTNRDISMVFYLNDDYEGGDFVFPDLKIRVRPEPGMLVCFPSNHHYKHGVEPVTKGKRYSIVCWAQVKGFPTMEDQNKELSQKYGIDVTN
jgi:predicted 2-oxoglutarate/Fe(II)-dependent dioxygenase YbiX